MKSGRQAALLVGTLAAAFSVRVLVRLHSGHSEFLQHGYLFYRALAERLLSGDGLCLEAGFACAIRTPLYPLLLTPFVATGALYPGAVFAQAALGSVLVWCVFLLGRHLFGARTGLLAAILAAASPYAVVHDTALQETVLVNTLLIAAVYQLARARQSDRHAVAAGTLVALAVLTTARVAPVAPLAMAWMAWDGTTATRLRLRRCALVAAPLVLLLGGWIARNWTVTGAPVLTTEAGASLWLANNEWTFTHFPRQSIDLSARESWRSIDPERRSALEALGTDEVGRDRLVQRWALQYVAAHPWETARGALRKVWVVLSAEYSPSRSPLVDTGYRVVYGVLNVLAAIGLWRARGRKQAHALVSGVLLVFLMTTAVYWAHTSHKSLIDSLIFIYAASTLTAASASVSVTAPHPAGISPRR